MNQNGKLRKLTECAMLVALAVVLNFIKIAPWPNGGSITCAAMVPIVLISLRHGWKWGILSGMVYSLTQMMLDGISTPPVENFLYYLLVVFLDYVVPFTILGVACIFASFIPASRPITGAVVGSVCVTLIRYLCHFISGIVIWGTYAPEGMPVWLYSLSYNGSFMIPEIVITATAAGLLYKFVIARGVIPKTVGNPT